MPFGKGKQGKVDAEYKKFEQELMEKARKKTEEKNAPEPPTDREVHLSGESRKKK